MTHLTNECLWNKESNGDFAFKPFVIIDKATQDHLDRCIADGRMTKEDPMKYIQSGAFMQFKASLHRAFAEHYIKQAEKIE